MRGQGSARHPKTHQLHAVSVSSGYKAIVPCSCLLCIHQQQLHRVAAPEQVYHPYVPPLCPWQAKLFPPYFQLQAVCIGLLMGSLMLSAAGLARSQALILGTLCTLV